MRDLTTKDVDQYRDKSTRVIQMFGGIGDYGRGFFWVPSVIDRFEMKVMASDRKGWDHVSVSRKNRCPNWPEMCQIKDLFFEPEETVMQLHVPHEDHVNNHNYCLHLWRPHIEVIPRPPSILVGVSDEEFSQLKEKAGI